MDLTVPVAGDTLHVDVRPAKQPRGTILLVHGFLSEGREFGETPARLAERGWTAAVVDLRGHGRSTGPRGYASARVAVEDLRAALDAVRKAGHAGPYGLLAHSAGSALALKFLPQAPEVRAAALVAPLNRLLDEVGGAERFGYQAAIRVNGLVTKLGLPSIKVPYKYATRKGYAMLYDDPKVAERAFADGFLQKQADLAWAKDMLAIDGETWAKEVRTPALVVLCTRDRILKNANSMKVHDNLAGEKKLVKVETCHSAFGDARAGEVVDAVDAWFRERLSGSAL